MLGGIPFAAHCLWRAIAKKGRQLLGWVLEVSTSFFAAKKYVCFKISLIVYRRLIPLFLTLNFLTLNYALFVHIALICFAGFPIHYSSCILIFFFIVLNISKMISEHWCIKLLISVVSWVSGLENCNLTSFCLAFKIQLEMDFFYEEMAEL